MFASSFIINEQNRLYIVLTNVLSSSLVLFSPLYILLLSQQLRITRCHFTSVTFASMHVGEGPYEVNFISTKCEHL